MTPARTAASTTSWTTRTAPRTPTWERTRRADEWNPLRGYTSAAPPATHEWNPLRGYTSAAPPATHEWNPLRGYLPFVQIPFTSSPRSSLGVEWELELVDLDSRELRGAASDILGELGRPHGGEHPK